MKPASIFISVLFLILVILVGVKLLNSEPIGQNEKKNQTPIQAQSSKGNLKTDIVHTDSKTQIFDNRSRIDKGETKTIFEENNVNNSHDNYFLEVDGDREIQPQRATSSVEEAINNDEDDLDTPEFREWKGKQITETLDVISSEMSDDAKEFMGNLIQNKSEFYKERQNKHPETNDDDSWSYNAQKELYSLIESHPLSADYRVLKISCKELMCEVIGEVYNQSSWEEIHFGILTNATNIIPPWDKSSQKLTVTHYKQEGARFAYVLYEYHN